MEKDERKVVYGIRGKLVSAVAMLLVACIMVVSSTYAWFTLSTAPEVTGISTAVGANGALEMMLTSWTGDDWYNGATGAADVNNTWGNLVDLSDKNDTIQYGSGLITLYPSKLNLAANGQLVRNDYLSFPKYGADGRPEANLTGETVVGKYQGDAFYQDDAGYGFRVVGSASGLTARQLAYRDAVSAVSVNMNLAVNAAKKSLDEKADPNGKSNGTILADIAMMKGMQADPTFTDVHVDAIERMVAQLKVASGHLEDAYVQALLAFAASSESGLADDAAFTTIKNSVTDETTYSSLYATLEAQLSQEAIAKLALLNFAHEKLETTNTQISLAETEAGKLTGGSYKWAGATQDAPSISKSLAPLVNVEQVTVNGRTVSAVKADPNSLISDYGQGKGITVSMPTGSGVYSDIADQCGDFYTSILLDTSTMGISLGGGLEVSATMSTKTTVNPVYVKGVMDGHSTYAGFTGTAVAISGKSPSGTGATKPLTEFYGYIVDLTFRTNAAQANLLLSEAVDRIYTDNNNEATMGHGSTMTFKSSDPSFLEDNVKDLMRNIRIVFFETGINAMGTQETILAYAELDVDNATFGVDGVTAAMYIPKSIDYAYSYTDENNAKQIVYVTATTTGEEDAQTTTYSYFSDYEKKHAITLPEGIEFEDLTHEADHEVKSYEITSLNQNESKRISALVYLDGETIQNSDVAASAAQSMSGTVNFQFKTDAPLVPMEYADLHTPNTPSSNN